MDSMQNGGEKVAVRRTGATTRFLPLAAGLVAIWLTFAVVSVDLGQLTELAVAALSVAFAAACFAASKLRRNKLERPSEIPARPPVILTREFEEKLRALDEANEVFGTALNTADMFRLVSSRLQEIFPFAASALIIPDDGGSSLRFVHVDGVGTAELLGLELDRCEGLAGRACASGEIEIDKTLCRDTDSLGSHGFVSAAAIPMIYDDETFAIFQIFTSEPISAADETITLLEAIAEHITPIFRGSLAFERTLSGALTDSLTGLPNERAFRMVLENQLAESVRHREDRPLAILSIDIRDFGAVNSMLGHAAGDRMLNFVASYLGRTLRKMDFLARTINDEFNIILPLASEAVAFEVIERIRSGFDQNEFEIADGEGVVVALNIGWATVWKDGETTEQLLRAAQQRKRQAKSESPADVLWFPREYVH